MSIVFTIQITPQVFASIVQYSTNIYDRKLSDHLCENHKILNIEHRNISIEINNGKISTNKIHMKI